MGNACCSNADSKHDTDAAEIHPKELPGSSTDDFNVSGIADKIPTAAAGREKEIVITLQKRAEDRLGVDVDHQDGVSLLIDEITEGLVKSWNDANPDKKVEKGDRIVEVNGNRGEVLRLVEECKKTGALKMCIKKDGHK
mmetsp:Transcript_97115/g.202858  ORF Transcript_97115/g.202858 Transcript_97115/m.202858 type:complete len:139 (+) Transcript_97115:89-505(+)